MNRNIRHRVSLILIFIAAVQSSPAQRSHRLKPAPTVLQTVRNSLSQSVDQYKYLMKQVGADQWPRTFENGVNQNVNLRAWISGFYPGTLLYLYEFSKDEALRSEALKKITQMEVLKTMTGHHDLGFMMYCSYGNAYRLYPQAQYQDILVRSAQSLATRFDPRVGCIKSWDQVKSLDKKRTLNFPVIIDNMMNLELLFFASRVTGEAYYKNIAIKHAATTLQNHLRPDFSSYHVVDYDVNTGKVVSRETQQGFSDNSTWSRGQAWGIYGFTMVYRETKERRFLEAACKMADFYIHHDRLPADKVPFWDFNVGQPGYDPVWNYKPSQYKEVPRDASAAAITASALIELAGYVNKQQRTIYQQAAESMIQSLCAPAYRAATGRNGGFILEHASGGVPGNIEVDVPLSYADYYYVEALMRYLRLKK